MHFLKLCLVFTREMFLFLDVFPVWRCIQVLYLIDVELLVCSRLLISSNVLQLPCEMTNIESLECSDKYY